MVFEPLVRVTTAQVHLHLQHPFIQRILARFLAQGYSAQDLSRVTVIRDPTEDIVRAVAFGRLSLFGPGAARLHDEIVPLMAPWYESGGYDHPGGGGGRVVKAPGGGYAGASSFPPRGLGGPAT